MTRYRFVGSFSTVADREFSRFGQWVDWDESYYRMIVRTAPFIPEADFVRIGFTSEELARYAEYSQRILAPDSFNSKAKQALMILRDVRSRLNQPYECVADPEVNKPQEV